jgi:hypothetical protein
MMDLRRAGYLRLAIRVDHMLCETMCAHMTITTCTCDVSHVAYRMCVVSAQERSKSPARTGRRRLSRVFKV